MTYVRRLLVVLVSSAIGLIASQEISLARSATSVTCVQPDGIVYKRQFERALSEADETSIERHYSKAMCIFLKAGEGFVPLEGHANSDDGSLAAALSIISKGEVGEAYPESIEAIVGTDLIHNDEATKEVAVSIYKMVPIVDILAHWKLVSSNSGILASFVPSIRTQDGISLLSLKNVPESKLENVCRQVNEQGLRCITTF